MKPRSLMRFSLVMAVIAALAGQRAQAFDDEECMICHGERGEDAPYIDPDKFTASIHGENQCMSCHSDIEDVPHKETLAKVDCSECHSIESEIYTSSYHGEALGHGTVAASCQDCHGNAHELLDYRNTNSPVHRANITETCASCHGDVERMRQYNLTQDAPISSYSASVHGLASENGRELSAVCTDCHGSHDLHRATDPESKLYWSNIPQTCGKCHENVRNTFMRSIHGQAVEDGIHDAPVCTSCHGEHSIDAVKQESSKVYPSHITETCSQCHAATRLITKYRMPEHAVDTYMSSYHGLSLQAGSMKAANCASCHGAHNILPSSDPRSSVHKNNLTKTCGLCHPGVSDQVARGQIHSGTRPGLEHRVVTIVRRIYLALIALVLGGMFIHNILDFIKKVRVHYRESTAAGRPKRMSVNERIQHAILAIAFILLAYTGFALRFPNAFWAAPFAGESEWRGMLHRIAAIAFTALALYHMVYLFLTARGRKQLKALALNRADMAHPFQMFGYYLGLRKNKPVFGFYSYAEKMEYWALVWGTIIMVLTGAMMTWEGWTLRLFPKWVYDVVNAIHYYEAILACGAIILWHFYFVMFDPDEYPMKATWLTGDESEADRHHRDPDAKLDD